MPQSDKFIITINREYGCGGRQIALELGKLLGVKVYDHHFIEELTKEFHLTMEQMDEIKFKKLNWWDEFTKFYGRATAWSSANYYENPVETVTPKQIYLAEERILKALADKESCIILGCAGFHIFRDYENAIKMMFIADINARRDRIGRKLNISDGMADQQIRIADEKRENYVQAISGKSRYDVHNYDIVLNVTNLEPESVAQFLAQSINQKLQGKANDQRKAHFFSHGK
ncbi:MAG: cytidylate kinase-like family protein [Paludibacteraceae bacterium]|nr:cytidylate kinase-like family protein [Paludibacteraceae bacterium]